MYIVSNLITFLLYLFTNYKDPVQNVEKLPRLDQNQYPAIQKGDFCGGRKIFKDDCQMISAAINDIAYAHKEWTPILYNTLSNKIKKLLSSKPSKDPIETALRKKIVSAVSLNGIIYLIPNPQKIQNFTKNFLPKKIST